MNEDGVKANSFKKVILAIAVVLTIGSVAGFYYTQERLRQLTIDTNTALARANRVGTSGTKSGTASDSETDALSQKAIGMLYSINNFQALATADIQKYANESGVTLNKVSLTTVKAKNLPALFDNITAKRIIVSIGSPVSFEKLMKFIKAIETNNPKMQITNLNLSNIHANVGDVTVEPITIEVYTK